MRLDRDQRLDDYILGLCHGHCKVAALFLEGTLELSEVPLRASCTVVVFRFVTSCICSRLLVVVFNELGGILFVDAEISQVNELFA